MNTIVFLIIVCILISIGVGLYFTIRQTVPTAEVPTEVQTVPTAQVPTEVPTEVQTEVQTVPTAEVPTEVPEVQPLKQCVASSGFEPAGFTNSGDKVRLSTGSCAGQIATCNDGTWDFGECPQVPEVTSIPTVSIPTVSVPTVSVPTVPVVETFTEYLSRSPKIY